MKEKKQQSAKKEKILWRGNNFQFKTNTEENI